MKVPFVDLKAQYLPIRKEIDDAIQHVIEKDLYVGGKAVSKFEAEFANYIGVDHCISCANGTDAIEIALKALGVGPGDEVIVPALTWISTAGAVSNVGAEPVFVDVLPLERTIDHELIEEKLTPRTKAIIPVHLYGLPARMAEISALAKRNDLKIVEDCAQAHGSEINGEKGGSFGDIATFSFYPSKNLGAFGDGGAITTKDARLAELCRRLSNHGQLERHDHRLIGRNSRLDSIQAAVLSVKLRYLDGWNNRQIEIAKAYSENLKRVICPTVPVEYRHVFHLYVIQSEHRGGLIKRLEDAQIGYGIHYPKPLPFVESYTYKNHKEGEFPVAERLCKEVLSLPMYAELSTKQINSVFESLNSFNI